MLLLTLISLAEGMCKYLSGCPSGIFIPGLLEGMWGEWCSVAPLRWVPGRPHLRVYSLCCVENQQQVRKRCWRCWNTDVLYPCKWVAGASLCFLSEGFPKFLHIFHLSETQISIQHSRISCGFVPLLGGLWFHKTMKRLCLSRLIPSVTDVILIIYFFKLKSLGCNPVQINWS